MELREGQRAATWRGSKIAKSKSEEVKQVWQAASETSEGMQQICEKMGNKLSDKMEKLEKVMQIQVAELRNIKKDLQNSLQKIQEMEQKMQKKMQRLKNERSQQRQSEISTSCDFNGVQSNKDLFMVEKSVRTIVRGYLYIYYRIIE